MSRAISIVGVRPLGWLAACARAPSEGAWRGRAQRNCVALVRGAGATRAARAGHMGVRDDRACQYSGPGQR